LRWLVTLYTVCGIFVVLGISKNLEIGLFHILQLIFKHTQYTPTLALQAVNVLCCILMSLYILTHDSVPFKRHIRQKAIIITTSPGSSGLKYPVHVVNISKAQFSFGTTYSQVSNLNFFVLWSEVLVL